MTNKTAEKIYYLEAWAFGVCYILGLMFLLTSNVTLFWIGITILILTTLSLSIYLLIMAVILRIERKS